MGPRPKALYEVLTFAEAAEKWGLGESTLRSAIHRGRFEEGKEVRKSGKTWLITVSAMKRVYGESKEND